MKSKLKLWFFPKAVGTALANNVLVPSQLNNPNSLNDILSDRVVGKIHFMNNLSEMQDNKLARSLSVLGLTWLTEYACNAKDWAIKWLPDGFISALAEDGDEALSGHIDKQLQHFHVPFTVVRINNKEYGIIFGDGISLENPDERVAYLKRDMEMLLTTVSPETSQIEMLHEPVFNTFVDLNV